MSRNAKPSNNLSASFTLVKEYARQALADMSANQPSPGRPFFITRPAGVDITLCAIGSY